MPDPVALDAAHTEQIRILERDLGQFGTRFDRHLEIYAQNGKELAALKSGVVDLSERIGYITKYINESDKKFVTREAFWPVKTLVYSLVGIILLAVVGAWVSFILVNGDQSKVQSEATNAATQAVQNVLSQYNVQVKQ